LTISTLTSTFTIVCCSPRYNEKVTTTDLDNWYKWADDIGLDEESKAFCYGPKGMVIKAYDKAAIGALCFTTAKGDLKLKGKNSIVMIVDGNMSCGMAFGNVDRFLTVSSNAWVGDVQIFQAKFYKDGGMNQSINCPIVKTLTPRQKSEFWFANAIQPVKVALLPQYNVTTLEVVPNTWQVLGTSPTFFQEKS
jgi:hypothetical protein